MGYLGSTWVEGFWFGWFYVVNWGLVVAVQGARWEGLVGCKSFAKACDLGGLRMIEWVTVLHSVRVCDFSC